MICGIPVRVKREMFVASLFFYADYFFDNYEPEWYTIGAQESMKPVHFCTGSQHQTIKWIRPNQ
jgi:hypothetical protein